MMLKRNVLVTIVILAVMALAACQPATPAVPGETDEPRVVATAPATEVPAQATATMPEPTVAATATTEATETSEPTEAPTDTQEPTAAATEAADTPGAVPGTGAAVCQESGVTQEQLMEDGEQVYADNCAVCHGAEGEGEGSFPALAGNDTVMMDDSHVFAEIFLESEVHQGLLDELTDDELAATLTFVRNSFGNEASIVCPEVVEAGRSGQ